jgi:Rrf2 family nitric oxide-sensitive transcriptional repressor
MKLTQFTDYSLRLLLYLAGTRGRLVTVKEAAEHYNISQDHLKKIARHLAATGYVAAQPGRNGGFALAREPADINLGQVVRESENLRLLPCLEDETCPITGYCKLKHVMQAGLGAFMGHLDNYTLADLI